ncbi:MAG: undecaprenyl-diphosphate phosphatase [Bacilli bacterium]|jgi:undecaprenyl-diphosphatase
MWEVIKYIILGIVQGVTEIFPISSSGHLVIFETMLGMEEPGLVFEMFTNTASFIALVILFHKDIWFLLKHFFGFIFVKDKREEYRDGFFYSLKLMVMVIPLGIVGFIVKDYIGGIKNLLTVGICLFVTGALLVVIYATRNIIKEHDDITWKDAIIMGLTQTFAVLPGLSRSGSTIIGGRASRVSLKSILKFSFLAYLLISIPTGALNIVHLAQGSYDINWLGYSFAFVFAGLATFFTGYFVMKKLEVKHLIYFGIYCLVVGTAAFVTFFFI